jgi:anti-sigma regulatory factor (Ser/Thr protein kinase)
VSDRSGAEIKAMSRLARAFPARIDALTRVAAFVEEVSALAGFTRHDCLRLSLVLEELFTNTVEHGYGGDSEGLVQIACEIEPGRVAVTYEDAAPGFDPLAPMTQAGPSPGDADRAPGRLGLALIARMAVDLDYQRAGGRNRISLTVPASG